MRLPDKSLEALEWGGLLHDIGKIGVPDYVLNKPDRLTKEERAIMNAHPVIGANIIAPVTKLAPELPIIRHHHEWFNGSGYPDRLIGEEIPLMARILHVADAFEAMTAARPYRMKPLTSEQAMAELRRFAGVQFDPAIVDAFTQTHWAAGVNDPGRTTEPRPPVPLLAQAAGRLKPSAPDGAGPAAPGSCRDGRSRRNVRATARRSPAGSAVPNSHSSPANRSASRASGRRPACSVSSTCTQYRFHSRRACVPRRHRSTITRSPLTVRRSQSAACRPVYQNAHASAAISSTEYGMTSHAPAAANPAASVAETVASAAKTTQRSPDASD